jgi:ABC-2 type transport system permease protein
MPPILRTALLIAAKDLRQRIRDRSVILFAIVAPLGLATIFSQLLAGTTGFHATWIVMDADRGELARVFRTDVVGSMERAGAATVRDSASDGEARAAVAAGDADAAFFIPEGFTAAVTAGQTASIEIIGARARTLSTEVARSLAERFADGIAAVELSASTASALAGRQLTGEEIAAVVAAATAGGPSIRLENVEAGLRQLDAPTHFSAAMAILFLFFAAQAGLLSLFEERRQGTLARILAGPVGPGTILLGKTFGSFLTGVGAMTILVLATTQLLGAQWGPPFAVALMVVAAVVASIGITALVTSFMRTQDGAGSASSAVAITLGILGGTFAPTAQAPELMQTVSLLTPHGWFLRGLGDLQEPGASVAVALPAIAVLLAMGLATGALGFARSTRLVAAR